MKTKCLKAVLAASLLSFYHEGYSQQIGGTSSDPKLSPGNQPNGTSLSNLYNLNLYDGSANLNFPIFQYSSSDGDNYGVSFTYNTKGIKAEQDASVVGLGFNLAAGGSIQRILKDIPDEMYVPQVYSNVLDYYGGYIDFNKIRGRYNASFETPAEAAETEVYRDKESDDFIVAIGSLNFTFNIGKQRAIFTHPDRRVKIEMLVNGMPVESLNPYPASILNTLEFHITDERGVQYYFKPGSTENRGLESAYANPGEWGRIWSYDVITSWVIDKIVASNGAIVQFSYITNQEGALSSPYIPYSNISALEVNGNVSIQSPNTNGQTKSVISQISYPNNTTVDFLYEDNPNIHRCDYGSHKALRKIKVSSGGNCLYYLLDHAYFVAATPGNTTFELPYGTSCTDMSHHTTMNNILVPSSKAFRLKLKSIRMQSCDGTVTEPYYTFDYDAMPLGVKGSGQDWFGYYNGKKAVWQSSANPPSATASGLTEHVGVPHHIALNNVNLQYGVNKDPDITYMRAGVLTKVWNAYGGNITFEYGEHNFMTNPLYDLFTLPDIAGGFFGENANDGLCLKSIIEREDYHPNSYKRTTFDYEEGQRFLTGGYFHYPNKLADATSSTATEVSWMSAYVTPHHLVNGSNHGYGKVTTTVRDNNNALLSKRVTTFTNFKDATSNNLPRYQLLGSSKNYFDFPYTEKQWIRDWEMGLPLTITEYDQNNRIVKKIENTYKFTTDLTSSQTKQVINQREAKVRYAGAPVIVTNWGGEDLTALELRSFSNDYRPYTGTALIEKNKTYTYLSDNSYTLDSVAFKYDSRNNIEEIITNNSDGTNTKTINYYNYSTANPSGTLLAMNIAGLEKQLGSERWILNGSALDRIVGAGFQAYNYNSGKLTVKNAYDLIAQAPINVGPSYGIDLNAVFSGSAINNFQKASEIMLADEKGNPLESKILDQDIYNGMIWDALTGQKVAEANCRYQDMAYSGFETATKGNWTYNQADVVASGAVPVGGINGKQVLMANFTASPISVNGLTAGKEYIINFWCSGGTPVLAGGGLSNIPLSVIYSPGNGWQYYEARFTPLNSSSVGLVATGSPGPGAYYIDEIRLFPSTALMQSWTYEPLFGVSSVTDGRGITLFYEYDKLGRQTIVRDQQKNILLKTKQVVQGQ